MVYTHTHTHTHIYIYIYIYIRGSLNKFPDFSYGHFYCSYTQKTLVLFEVISSALVVPFQQLLEVLLCERVNDLRHSLFHLLSCLITTVSELREYPKVTGSKVWTLGRLRHCLDTHLGPIVCDKDGDVDWCKVLVEKLLSRFEACWPLPRNLFPNSLKTSTW